MKSFLQMAIIIILVVSNTSCRYFYKKDTATNISSYDCFAKYSVSTEYSAFMIKTNPNSIPNSDRLYDINFTEDSIYLRNIPVFTCPDYKDRLWVEIFNKEYIVISRNNEDFWDRIAKSELDIFRGEIRLVSIADPKIAFKFHLESNVICDIDIKNTKIYYINLDGEIEEKDLEEVELSDPYPLEKE